MVKLPQEFLLVKYIFIFGSSIFHSVCLKAQLSFKTSKSSNFFQFFRKLFARLNDIVRVSLAKHEKFLILYMVYQNSLFSKNYVDYIKYLCGIPQFSTFYCSTNVQIMLDNFLSTIYIIKDSVFYWIKAILSLAQ